MTVDNKWNNCNTETLLKKEFLGKHKGNRKEKQNKDMEEIEASDTNSYNKHQTQPNS